MAKGGERINMLEGHSGGAGAELGFKPASPAKGS